MPLRATIRSFLALLLFGALTSGCWLVHGRGGPTPPAGRDAGITFADGGSPADAATLLRDAAVPRGDAAVSPRDAGPMVCALARPDATCLESFLIAPGRAFSLPFVFDQCACCAETECAVAVDVAGRRLELTTTLCPDPCDCDACHAPTGTCAVPPLPSGDWRVSVNGAPAFVLPVHEDSGLVPPPPACASYAEIDRCEPTGAPSSHRWSTPAACAEHVVGSSPLDVIRVFDPCWSCHLLDGPCVASLTPRFTDDLPPGGDIHVEPEEYGTTCDVDCPEVCVVHARECVVPSLVDGDFYRVIVDEVVISTFVAGAPSDRCAFAGVSD